MPGQNSPLISRRQLGISLPKSFYDIVQRPVTIDPPPEAKPIIVTGVIPMPQPGDSAVIIEYRVPTNNSAVIWKIGNGSMLQTTTGFVTTIGEVIWYVLKNGSPFEGLNNITTVIGLIEQMGGLLAAPLWAPQNTLIQLVIHNVNVAPSANVPVGLFNGYRYPSRLDPPGLR